MYSLRRVEAGFLYFIKHPSYLCITMSRRAWSIKLQGIMMNNDDDE